SGAIGCRHRPHPRSPTPPGQARDHSRRSFVGARANGSKTRLLTPCLRRRGSQELAASAAPTTKSTRRKKNGGPKPAVQSIPSNSEEVVPHRHVPVARQPVVRGLDVADAGELLALGLVVLVGQVEIGRASCRERV